MDENWPMILLYVDDELCFFWRLSDYFFGGRKNINLQMDQDP